MDPDGRSGVPVTRAEASRRRRSSARLGWLAVVATIVGLTLANVVAYRAAEGGGTPTPGTYVAPSEIEASPPSTSTSTAPTRTARSRAVDPATGDRRTASAATVATIAVTPGNVTVTARGGRVLVDTGVVPTYLAAGGELAPPAGTAGWYAERGWPRPGEPGASILVGHVDQGGRPDVFWNLPQATAGDRVSVRDASGRSVDFRVVRSQAMAKTQVPKDTTIWDWKNPRPLLRLITCDPTTPINAGHYEGNWVVWAEPV